MSWQVGDRGVPTRRAMCSGLALTVWLTCGLSCGFVLGQAPEEQAPEEQAAVWTQYRGPRGDGHAVSLRLPTQWSQEDIQWQVDLPAEGQSSPVIWEDKIFLTGAIQRGDAIERHVYCVDGRTRQIVWDRIADTGAPEELHKMNSWATPTCATDGEWVVAFFGAGGLHCYDLEGQLQWSRKLGDFPGAWGVGASPIILDQLVIQNGDATGSSFLLAVDKRTGKDVWRTKREDKPRGGWSTPVVVQAGGRTQMLLNGEFGVRAYDPQSGEELWFCQGFNGRGTPMPVYSKGKVLVVNGKAGDVYAVRPGGSGNVTQSHRAWNTRRGGGRDLPSPIAVQDWMLVVSMSGILTCYEIEGGRELWKARLGGNFSSSPIAANGLAYFLAENGEVLVVRPGDKYELVSRNRIQIDDDEVFRSSPAVASGQLLLRSNKRLYSLGRPLKAE